MHLEIFFLLIQVPRDYKATSTSSKLDVWIGFQRKYYKKNQLPYSKIKLLEEIGLDLKAVKKFDCPKNDRSFEIRYNELLAYR